MTARSIDACRSAAAHQAHGGEGGGEQGQGCGLGDGVAGRCRFEGGGGGTGERVGVVGVGGIAEESGGDGLTAGCEHVADQVDVDLDMRAVDDAAEIEWELPCAPYSGGADHVISAVILLRERRAEPCGVQVERLRLERAAMAGQVRVCAGASQPVPGGAEDPGVEGDRGAEGSGLPFPVVDLQQAGDDVQDEGGVAELLDGLVGELDR